MIPSIIDSGQINRDIYESIRDLRNKEQTLANGGAYCDYFITGNRE